MIRIFSGHGHGHRHGPCHCRTPRRCHAQGHCHGPEAAYNYGSHHSGHQGRRKGRKSRWSDSCDVDCCDGPDCCDFGLFSSLLTLGAVAAGVAGRGSAGRAATRPPRASGRLDRAGLAAIRGYRRWLSHRWPGQCRFTPTCSAYGLAAVDRYGLAVGGRMAAQRLRRCRPDVPRGTVDTLA